MPTLDHRFALSMPALLSAPAKKSFSSASSPIWRAVPLNPPLAWSPCPIRAYPTTPKLKAVA